MRAIWGFYCNVFCFPKFFKHFLRIHNDRNPSYKNEIIEGINHPSKVIIGITIDWIDNCS